MENMLYFIPINISNIEPDWDLWSVYKRLILDLQLHQDT